MRQAMVIGVVGGIFGLVLGFSLAVLIDGGTFWNRCTVHYYCVSMVKRGRRTLDNGMKIPSKGVACSNNSHFFFIVSSLGFCSRSNSLTSMVNATASNFMVFRWGLTAAFSIRWIMRTVTFVLFDNSSWENPWLFL
jgi:hypothetical protein